MSSLPRQRIRINSSDRSNPSTTAPGDFTLHSKIAFEGTYQLHAIYCPLNFFNVNSQNNQVYFREGGIDKVAVISPGFYVGPANLMANLATALTTASGGVNLFTVTEDSLTGLLTITASTVDFTLTFSNTASSAAEVLGFAPMDVDSNSLALTGIRQWNLATVRSLNFIINDIVSIVDTNQQSCTLTLPILNDMESVQYYEVSPLMPQFFTFRDRTNALHIKVVDDKGRVLPLQGEWYMMISKTCG